MSSYTLQRAPATYSAMAGALMLGTVIAAQAKVDAMDSFEIGMNRSTMVVGQYRESGVSSTIRVNAGEPVFLGANHHLDDASQAFVNRFSSGLQPLGSHFSQVLEDNFWDLVLG